MDSVGCYGNLFLSFIRHPAYTCLWLALLGFISGQGCGTDPILEPLNPGTQSSGTIGADGGSISLQSQAAHPVPDSNLVLTVPPGVVSNPVEATITLLDASIAPDPAVVSPAVQRWGQAYEISFDGPLSGSAHLAIPVMSMQDIQNSGKFPCIVSYDKITGKYSIPPQGVLTDGWVSVDIQAGTVITAVAVDPNSNVSPNDKGTRFLRVLPFIFGRDSFAVSNNDEFTGVGGMCYGFATFASWYYSYHRENRGLHDAFSPETQRAIIQDAFGEQSNESLDYVVKTLQAFEIISPLSRVQDALTFGLISTDINLYHKPTKVMLLTSQGVGVVLQAGEVAAEWTWNRLAQTFGWSKINQNDFVEHSVMVYGISPGKLHIYDSNWETTREIEYSFEYGFRTYDGYSAIVHDPHLQEAAMARIFQRYSTPAIAGSQGLAAQENTAFAFTPTLTSGLLPVRWSLDQAPQGLTIDPDTGVISWPSPISGDYSTAIHASNDSGTATKVFSIHVTGIPNPLVASASAERTTLNTGESTTLHASVSGGVPPYIFAWSASGWSGAALSDTPVTPSSTTVYQLVVHDSSPSPQTANASVTVTVQSIAPPPPPPPPPAGTPDLIVQNLLVQPGSLAPGGSLTVSFSILNQGSASAADSTMRVRLNASDSDVTTNDSLLCEVETPEIPAGGTFDISEQVTIPQDTVTGTAYIWVILDVMSTAGQNASDEANDRAHTSIAITTGLLSKLEVITPASSRIAITSQSSAPAMTTVAHIQNIGDSTIYNINIESIASVFDSSYSLIEQLPGIKCAMIVQPLPPTSFQGDIWKPCTNLNVTLLAGESIWFAIYIPRYEYFINQHSPYKIKISGIDGVGGAVPLTKGGVATNITFEYLVGGVNPM